MINDKDHSAFSYGTAQKTLINSKGGDFDFLAYKVVSIMTALGMRLFTAESCTGGLVCKRLTDILGASRMLSGGVVCYTNEIKKSVLGVSDEIISKHTEVSGECAAEMAEGARRISGADIAVSATGYASGGDGVRDEDVGLIYIAISGDDFLNVKELRLSGNRSEVRESASDEIFKMIIDHFHKEGE